MRIGTLDSETLSLRTNAVVYSVGLLVIECNEFYEPTGQASEHHWHLSVLEQAALGRHIDPGTVKWALNQYGRRELEAQVVGAIPVERDKQNYLLYDTNNGKPLVEQLQALRSVAMPLDELWINKSSFDSGILHSLAEQCGIVDGLWKHKAELDLRPLYNKLPLGNVERQVTHTAVSDCYDNWATLQAFGQFLQRGIKKTRKSKR